MPEVWEHAFRSYNCCEIQTKNNKEAKFSWQSGEFTSSDKDATRLNDEMFMKTPHAPASSGPSASAGLINSDN